VDIVSSNLSVLRQRFKRGVKEGVGTVNSRDGRDGHDPFFIGAEAEEGRRFGS
jgi:hypothetical protein